VGYEGMGQPRNRKIVESFEKVPMYVTLLTYVGYGILILIGCVKEAFEALIAWFVPSQNPERNREVIIRVTSQNTKICDDDSIIQRC
jgi:hypothetical protein